MYKRKKKIPFKKVGIITIIIITMILGLVINISTTDRKLTIFEKAIKDSILSVTNFLSYPFRFLNVSDKKINKTDEYNKLKNENEELQFQIKELKETLELNKILSDFELLNATVINRDLGYWFDTLTIDKGEYSGVTVGMPIIAEPGLIGKVISTTTFTSTVRLLTANNSNDKISVKIQIDNDYAYGILSGYNEKNDTYIIEGISQNLDIKTGLTVTTTGMGDIFPSGIVIGQIVGVSTDNFDLAKILEIKSNVNFNKLNYVSVLKRGK